MSEKIDPQEVVGAAIAQVRELIAETAKRLDQIEKAYLEVKGQSRPSPPQPTTSLAPQPAPSPTQGSPQSSQPSFPWRAKDGRTLFHISSIGKGAYCLELPSPIPRDDPAVVRFLIPKILEAEKSKHSGFNWRMEERDGLITALHLEGVEGDLLHIKKAVGWTTEKALGRAQSRSEDDG